MSNTTKLLDKTLNHALDLDIYLDYSANIRSRRCMVTSPIKRKDTTDTLVSSGNAFAVEDEIVDAVFPVVTHTTFTSQITGQSFKTICSPFVVHLILLHA